MRKKKWLDETANIFPDISSWINWWDATKYHMFPAFRCFVYSNVTLAESGNSTLKWHMQLWLLEAALNDTSTMLTQINEFKSFLVQQTSSSSKGPCSLTQKMENRATQICAAKAYVTEFSNRKAYSAALEENANPQVFVPSGGARHRPTKTKTGIEGTFVQKKKQKKSSVNKNIHIGLGRQLKEAEGILAEKDVPIDCSPPCSQELLQENFPEVVLLAALGVWKCHGCTGKYWNKIASPPRIWFFAFRLLNMEIKCTNSMAKMLWKCLFSLTNIICSVIQP